VARSLDPAGASVALGALVGLLFGLLLFSTYYVAWFSLFAVAIVSAFAFVFAPRAMAKELRLSARSGWRTLLGVVIGFGVGIVPFVLTYLPVVSQLGSAIQRRNAFRREMERCNQRREREPGVGTPVGAFLVRAKTCFIRGQLCANPSSPPVCCGRRHNGSLGSCDASKPTHPDLPASACALLHDGAVCGTAGSN